MQKTLVTAALLALVCPSAAHSQLAPRIFLEEKTFTPTLRHLSIDQLSPLALRQEVLNQKLPRDNLYVGRFGLKAVGPQSSRFRPTALHIGEPLIQTKGIVRGGRFLYIADTGKDATHNEPARIWRFNPETRELVKFFEGPMLVNSKWIFFLEDGRKGKGELIVSDLGEEPRPRDPGTGVGAKVFSIPVSEDGLAGTPRVIYEGAPLRSPEGIAVIGNTIILSDWAAGATSTRPEAPGVPFLSGRLFAMPLSGGPPRILFPDQKWVTLVGAGVFSEAGKRFIRLIDLDGGRYDKSSAAALPQSGLPAYYRAEIRRAEPLELGQLEPILLEEAATVTVRTELAADEVAVLETLGQSRLEDGSKRRVLRKEQLVSGKLAHLFVRSLAADTSVGLKLSIVKRGSIVSENTVQLPKEQEGPFIASDPKNAIDIPAGDGRLPSPVTVSMCATTMTAFAFPSNGGVPAVLWRGAPFVAPIGVYYARDRGKLWMTDQSAGPDGTSAIFEIEAPSPTELRSMFVGMVVQRR